MATKKLILLIFLSFALTSYAHHENGRSDSLGLSRRGADLGSAQSASIPSADLLSRTDQNRRSVSYAPATLHALSALGLCLTISGVVFLGLCFHRAPIGFEDEHGFCFAEKPAPSSRTSFRARLRAMRTSILGHEATTGHSIRPLLSK